MYDRLSDETLENDGQALFEKVSSYGRSFITMKVQAVDDEGNKVSLDESVSRMKCGHLGNMPVGVSKSFPLSETKEFKTARPNVSYRLKVNEFASLVRQSLCPSGKGDKPNSVWSGLKHLRIPEDGDTCTCLFDRTFSD